MSGAENIDRRPSSIDSLRQSDYLPGMSIAYRESECRIKRSNNFEPCLPRSAKEPPKGTGWLHEIKHDGFRTVAQKDGDNVRLVTRNGYDFTERYPLIVDAIRSLPAKSCIVDGEAIVVDQNGLSVFDLLRYRRHDHAATVCAFDLIELDGVDLLRNPIEERKDCLATLLRQRHPGIALNETYGGDGALIYQHACALGCEGIVSKRLGSAYRMGRTDAWIKIKNPDAPAIKREREIDWAKR
jgi:bifunctional non-homologous end joining protein LigD